MDDVLKILGLARRKGDVIIGGKLVLDALKKRRDLAVFMASDTAANTRKKIMDKTKTHGVYLNTEYSSKTLSHAIGKESVKVLALIEQDLKIPRQ